MVEEGGGSFTNLHPPPPTSTTCLLQLEIDAAAEFDAVVGPEDDVNLQERPPVHGLEVPAADDGGPGLRIRAEAADAHVRNVHTAADVQAGIGHGEPGPVARFSVDRPHAYAAPRKEDV